MDVSWSRDGVGCRKTPLFINISICKSKQLKCPILYQAILVETMHELGKTANSTLF